MGRYYKIEIGGDNPITFTNQVNGKEDTGALEIHLDIPVSAFHVPTGAATVEIWGIGIDTIAQASNYQGAPITVYGGMQNGLPLATATVSDGQQGVLVQGQIFQSYGNWLGVNQTLNFVIVPTVAAMATQNAPGNIVLDWKKGTSLGDAIKNTLSVAFPSVTLNMNVDSSLVFGQDVQGYFQTITQFAQFVQQNSQAIKNPTGTGTYQGISITISDGAFNIFDGSSPAAPISLNAQDFVGQPTWIDAGTVQFNMVMRADLDLGDFIQFPQVLNLQTQTTITSQSQARNKLTFQGTFTINDIHHMGNSRGPDAQNWMTAFRAVSSSIPANTQGFGATSQ